MAVWTPGYARARRESPIQPRAPGRRRLNLAGPGGALLLVSLALLALFPQAVAPYDPSERVTTPLARPSAEFWLGANDIGQDLLSELIWGVRASLSIALLVGSLAVLIGAGAGLVSGYRSGWLRTLLLRLVDLTLVLPFLPLVILLSAYLGPGQWNVVLVLTLVSWATPARVIYAQVLALRTEPYIEAAHATGCTNRRIIARHLWPGVRLLVMTQGILVASATILAEASLSFLGLGDPAAKSWGTMLYFARASGAFLGDAWRWWVLPTGLLITLTILSLTLIAYALEEWVEPGLRR